MAIDPLTRPSRCNRSKYASSFRVVPGERSAASASFTNSATTIHDNITDFMRREYSTPETKRPPAVAAAGGRRWDGSGSRHRHEALDLSVARERDVVVESAVGELHFVPVPTQLADAFEGHRLDLAELLRDLQKPCLLGFHHSGEQRFHVFVVHATLLGDIEQVPQGCLRTWL